jgi:hypothetical protein
VSPEVIFSENSIYVCLRIGEVDIWRTKEYLSKMETKLDYAESALEAIADDVDTIRISVY